MDLETLRKLKAEKDDAELAYRMLLITEPDVVKRAGKGEAYLAAYDRFRRASGEYVDTLLAVPPKESS